jgi:hypothetical protein
MIGVSTIGNATLVAYDGAPILVTDPWMGDEDPAYFGSWMLTHEIPDAVRADILAAKYVWFSHGHPDHLNPISVERFRGRRILLPDHVNARIARAMLDDGFDARILPDRTWVQLSEHVRVHCITTVIQDAILVIDVNGIAFVNLNDAGTLHCTGYLRRLLSSYRKSYLMALAGYGDADMINFYDESGTFIVPPAKNNVRVGEQLTLVARSIGATGVIPFSSHHQYQRTDSLWAQEYVTPLHAYRVGLAASLEFVEPFSIVDCSAHEVHALDPEPLVVVPKPPEEFGDSWSDELDKNDLAKLQAYFSRKERVAKYLSFLNFRVGGKDNFVRLGGPKERGITFAVPRGSLMQAVEHEIFDDVLIGNFMKTTLHGMRTLYDGDFSINVANYADNGRAETEEAVRAYLATYRKRAGREFVYETFLSKAKDIAYRLLSANRGSTTFRLAKRLFYAMK